MLAVRHSSWLMYGYVLLLMLAMAFAFSHTQAFPQDDFSNYQTFIETLAGGKLDLTIPGFHGSDFFAVPLYWITRSSIAQIQFLILCAIALPAVAFFAGKALGRHLDPTGDTQSHTFYGVLLSTIITLMPFLSFVCLRGWTGPGNMMLLLLTVAFAASGWTIAAGIALGFAILSKPFAVALIPLLFVLAPRDEHRFIRRHLAILIGLAIAAVYLAIQYMQAGHIIVGSHTDVTSISVWQGPMRIALNLAHGLQILFSVHNYYFPNPALTGPGNMMHTTPVLTFLGLFAALAPRDYFARASIGRALLLGACIGIGLNALLDHMDHFYMEAGILCLILASLPLLKRYPLWALLALITLHFQWFYFYLQYRPGFGLHLTFFALPLLVDICAAGWALMHLRAWKNSHSHIL